MRVGGCDAAGWEALRKVTEMMFIMLAGRSCAAEIPQLMLMILGAGWCGLGAAEKGDQMMLVMLADADAQDAGSGLESGLGGC